MKRTAKLLFSIVLTLVLAEGAARLNSALTGKVRHPDPSTRNEWAWAAAHLREGTATVPGVGMHDAALGWRVRPGLDEDGVRTNSVGIRAGREYPRERTPGTRRLLLVGDSFTFGHNVPNEDAFAAVLERDLLEGTEVINLGVPGYGADQAVLMYETVGAAYAPDVVVLGFYARGFYRLALRFASAPKPWFTLDDEGTLVRHGVPVISPEALYAEYERGERRIGGWTFSHLYGLVGNNLARELGRRRVERESPRWQLMAALLCRFRDDVVASGARPLLIVFPDRSFATDPDSAYAQLDRLARAEAAALGIPCVSMTEPFVEREQRDPAVPMYQDMDVGGHLSAAGNRAVAEALHARLEAEGLLGAEVRTPEKVSGTFFLTLHAHMTRRKGS